MWSQQWERSKFTEKVAQKFQEAFRLSIVYFRAHHQELTLNQISEMIHQFSELIPDPRYRSWVMTICNETILHLLKIYLQKIEESDAVDAEQFSSTINAIGKFAQPLQRYCKENDPDKVLWRLAEIATSVVPHASPIMVKDMVAGFSQLLVYSDKLLNEVTLYIEVHLESFDATTLAVILRSFSRFEYVQCGRLVPKISTKIIPSVSELTTYLLAKLLWTISLFGWKNAEPLHDALLTVRLVLDNHTYQHYTCCRKQTSAFACLVILISFFLPSTCRIRDTTQETFS